MIGYGGNRPDAAPYYNLTDADAGGLTLPTYGRENEASNGVNAGRSRNALIGSEMGGAGDGRPEKRNVHLLEFG
ncbi:MAG: hypothetical protein K2G30_03340 [Muribaculaceae bacterium]|nr:hypothetical protein [Muribaculaceae bacterium]